MIEKPQDVNNNLVLVGFYYFRSGEALIAAIEEQMARGTSLKGEYYIVDAINVMLEKDVDFRVKRIETWLDTGIPATTLETNRYLIENRAEFFRIQKANSGTPARKNGWHSSQIPKGIHWLS